MDTSELLRRAWEAVEKSGVPESLHAVAFREAVKNLRASEGGGASATGESNQAGRTKRHRSSSAPKGGANAGTEQTTAPVDEAKFFTTLAHESGVSEADLRDVLSFSSGTVHITQPTRKLGSDRANQARTSIALVAGARAYGLGERPVDASAVRHELDRKGCYDANNFAAKHLSPLRGFNAGATRNHIVTTSNWVKEFVEAVDQALERKTVES
jgi:hypothetical protein